MFILICNNYNTSLHTQDLRLDVRYMLLNAKDLHLCAFYWSETSVQIKFDKSALNKMSHI